MPVNPQSEFLREPNLLIPNKKPIGTVKIDWSHPMTKALKAVVIGGYQINLVTGEQLVSRNTDVPLVNSKAFEFNSVDALEAEIGLLPTLEWTLFTRCTGGIDGSVGAGTLFGVGTNLLQFNRGFDIYYSLGKFRYLIRGVGGTLINLFGSASYIKGVPENICAVTRSNVDHKIFVGGIEVASSTSNITGKDVETYANIVILGAAITSNLNVEPSDADAIVEVGFTFYRGITDEEVS